ncbi:hypothetical protein GFER_11180 [Geoalkalibacter ferrihydriticus DSM 17813]|uniref:Uncharacterized protein n=2 Tax=Geoalkalibacter ferrihydriticus TaxID=392333 RepID=A0A0C2HGW0_9BACT|nr:hypothetical protein [Geoalkalibacter ferrihydriticus]KIH76201.1 hypothetical protein GFER_11180 [Geoalkalibacter ferrihydriticus DSM 17813]
MKRDRHPKIEIIGRHVPEFPGYRAIHHLETDRLLRHFLSGRLGEIRERLADFVAGLPEGGPRAALSESLRRLAQIKATLVEADSQQAGSISVSPEKEEALLDFDLNLLDKTAALAGAVDGIDREGGGPNMQALLAGLLEDLEELLKKRQTLLASLAQS